jgi:hypothetical protein
LKTQKNIPLPTHRRWALIAHPGDESRIKTTLAWEMGRRVLTDMGWQPHGDWVFFFLNGVYKGVYILAEVIKPETERLNITPLISSSNANGGFLVEMNNFYFYWDENRNNWDVPANSYTFDEMYNFMSSHQNPVGGYGSNKQQGVVFSFKEPDANMGWYYDDPPEGDGYLSFSNSAHAQNFPRKGIVLEATLGSGSAYNRASANPAQWKVPDDVGQSNGMGTAGMLLAGTNAHGANNGGVYGNRTLSQAYTGYGSSTFVKAAQILQNAEDAIYSHDWNDKGYAQGTYLNHIDIDSLIDWHIAHEMLSDWEMNILNGRYMRYDPSVGKFKMGPIWDMDGAWIKNERQSTPGFLRKIPFWLKEVMGWQVNSANDMYPGAGEEKPDRKDPYYVASLKSRWGTVRNSLGTELNQYIDAQAARFGRITSYGNQPIIINQGKMNGLKGTISDMVYQLDYVFYGY